MLGELQPCDNLKERGLAATGRTKQADRLAASHGEGNTAKQRVAVPAKLRRNTPGGEALEFVITLGLDGCLFLFTPERWDQLAARIKEHSFTNEKTKFLSRVLASNAQDVELDGQSRILIPKDLIEAVGLEKEVMFVGVFDRIEIWRPDRFKKWVQEQPDPYEKVAGDFLL